MNDIKRLLQDAVTRSGAAMGSKGVDPLEAELKRLRKRNEVYFALAFALVAIFFLGSGVIVFLKLDQPDLLKALFTVLGGTIFGSVVFLRNLWRRKIAIDLLLATFVRLTHEERRLVFEKLLKLI